jgi:hypothetical protein
VRYLSQEYVPMLTWAATATAPLLPIFQVRLLGTKHIKLITKARAMIALVVALFSWVVTPCSNYHNMILFNHRINNNNINLPFGILISSVGVTS